jgi:chromosome segregation ATPase
LGDALADPDLNFLARQIERLLTEIASLRDDMAVLTAMVMRLDGSHAALLQETRATHAQITRMNDRIRKLEAGGEVT